MRLDRRISGAIWQPWVQPSVSEISASLSERDGSLRPPLRRFWAGWRQGRDSREGCTRENRDVSLQLLQRRALFGAQGICNTGFRRDRKHCRYIPIRRRRARKNRSKDTQKVNSLYVYRCGKMDGFFRPFFFFFSFLFVLIASLGFTGNSCRFFEKWKADNNVQSRCVPQSRVYF